MYGPTMGEPFIRNGGGQGGNDCERTSLLDKNLLSGL